jgi:hypothetical protein
MSIVANIENLLNILNKITDKETRNFNNETEINLKNTKKYYKKLEDTEKFIGEELMLDQYTYDTIRVKIKEQMTKTRIELDKLEKQFKNNTKILNDIQEIEDAKVFLRTLHFKTTLNLNPSKTS